MKKNFMMRAASALLVAVLLSTCTISGTFAKYVTTASGSDQARVAKWGVTATVSGHLFSDSYKDQETTYVVDEDVATITVQAKNKDEKVVAPGTNSSTTPGDQFTIVLTGQPEVDVAVSMSITATKEICLPAGNYDDPRDQDPAVTFDLGEDYYPVVFTLCNGNGTVLATGTVYDINNYLEGISGYYHTNKNLAEIGSDTDGTYRLTWAWAFEGPKTLTNGVGTTVSFTEDQVDAADTYLGNNYSTDDMVVTFNLSVTQEN